VLQPSPLPGTALPPGISSRFIEGVNGLRVHVLEAGHEQEGRPLILLLHGFPELAYSWRKVMLPLAAAGFHVVAPDQRGYGRTTGWRADYDQDLRPFSMLNLVRDTLALVYALGRHHVSAVIGHDFGSPVAAWCALVRPDVFRACGMMSAPFAGPPSLPFAGMAVTTASNAGEIDHALANLDRPRKHYHWYYATPSANTDMQNCEEGVHAFLRAYFHHKSADWAGNKPFPLRLWSAEQLALMPAYYIMDRDKTMPETVAPFMPAPEAIAACRWMTENDLAIYAGEYQRTGFQGGLNWYRTRFDEGLTAEHALFASRTIDVPAIFIAGQSDWGVYQVPGVLDRMQHQICRQMLGCHLVEGAGHWVMQEQAGRVAELLVEFCSSTA
jgi:pimeloyl-ACP methyl ester carboxylesterase